MSEVSRCFSEDVLLLLHINTTRDEHALHVPRDAVEVVELACLLIDTTTLSVSDRFNALARPVNTPFTEAQAAAADLNWHQVAHAGVFAEAIKALTSFIEDKVISRDKTFSFACFTAWDLRVQLVREARDKQVYLPPYLEHPRLYEIRTEYLKWHARNPEAVPFGAISAVNVCAALQIAPDSSSSWTTPKQHQQEAALSGTLPASNDPLNSSRMTRTADGWSPETARESLGQNADGTSGGLVECKMLYRILLALLDRSNDEQDPAYRLFLTAQDAAADIQSFADEQSRVIFLAGMAHDTTQSELESWFNQHGGRPIAFWTLRTPDQSTGTGFAVFQTHKEAAQAIYMNGRALADRAIEVAPSSSRVLDRASSILAPFPPSKNRPRPGDWTCPACGFSNFQRRTACFRCSFPLSAATSASNMSGGQHPLQLSVSVHAAEGSIHPGASFPTTFYSPTSNASALRLSGGGAAAVGSGAAAGGAVPFRAGDWSCDVCGFHNFARNPSCLKCSSSRPSSSHSSTNYNYQQSNQHQSQQQQRQGQQQFFPAAYQPASSNAQSMWRPGQYDTASNNSNFTQ
ncbi:Asparagine-rich protein (ARP protein) [Savitreella phatthalungensis]